jgi:hypothetical protein
VFAKELQDMFFSQPIECCNSSIRKQPESSVVTETDSDTSEELFEFPPYAEDVRKPNSTGKYKPIPKSTLTTTNCFCVKDQCHTGDQIASSISEKQA